MNPWLHPWDGSLATPAAQQLLRAGLSDAARGGADALLRRLVICRTVEACGFFWFFYALLFGPLWTSPESNRDPTLAHLWDVVFANFSARVRHARSSDLKHLSLGESSALDPLTAESESSLLVWGASMYGQEADYFEQPHVAPFLRHLRCYAAARGMRFIVDEQGPRIHHQILAALQVNIPMEYFIATQSATDEGTNELQTMVNKLLSGELEDTKRLVDAYNMLSVNRDDPAKFTKVWAVSEHLGSVSAKGLLLLFDIDVTIRPDSFHHGVVELMLEEPAAQGRQIFLPDTWPGMECVNSGFLALRNSEVPNAFVRLWLEKLWWPASWEQGALAETVLEVLGQEASQRSGGQFSYNSECLPFLFPLANGIYPWADYCQCWQSTLESLVGPFGRRKSSWIHFINPDHLEVNFVPNDLFWDHRYDLRRMHLLPRAGQAVLEPLVVHWAGLGKARLRLMEVYLAKRFNLSAAGCPRLPASKHKTFGSPGRLVRCCRQLQVPTNLSGGENAEPYANSWWGWCDRHVAAEKLCLKILGRTAARTQSKQKESAFEVSFCQMQSS